MSRERTLPPPPRTVAEELHKIWLLSKRKKDAERIVELAKKMNEIEGFKKYPISKPTIEKALLYGHCLDDSTSFLITSFFNARHDSEGNMAETMNHQDKVA